ncbi:glutamine--fructose-6-phosphate transaminase (isomerizing) [Burkholderia vietnamiensis]|jgi:glucosamine--fructose-6-phosphate aminotransferase (isomerizing)|uniref:glutamine--fructose-6-phosphate transaminase (isomerizing) n=1 Tax=Burkholderia vietnamiensis TaxID=60552 RepID=UPI000755BBB5|nr:glutamine--fructose-6-phosphate transaminase (isomerizing) [Burkholderia vietnamiensis]KVF36689.1 glutamine--fructose-6-phosphate aminotransferase [Burkholderia vietnamiensis]MCA8192737.1 glutamine--fructose-6-phosphate transaminase (isomerizing) [Burkholderia vietnamiensis]MDN7407616.1 glutamine--fructose-6-phosphate transaminase (isomerizing) [Burkholderia vietnamiensis]MDN8114371.1 glutamine--fructose-6-phosphate transaminase (isomerizing) [Burkholderia vietnamiensis]QTK87621.1 glutamine
MCGIVGASGLNNQVPQLVKALSRLEYRGYDSCGIAVLRDGRLCSERTLRRVADLQDRVLTLGLEGQTGIAHTRWATHGAPSEMNAHPIMSGDTIAVVHNGIIENHDTLRAELRQRGYMFRGETDTEVIAHLIHSVYRDDLLDAVRRAVKRLHGAYAIAVLSACEPQRLVAARAGSPLVIGIGADQNYLASDCAALGELTDRFVYLEDGDVALITPERIAVVDSIGSDAQRPLCVVRARDHDAALGPYRHFMQKEIFEQPKAIAATLDGVDTVSPALFGDDETARALLSKTRSVLLLGCGTSYYAGLTAKYWLESIAGIRAQVEIASEYRYRETVPDPHTLVVGISQSGETADTIGAIEYARAMGQHLSMAICNVATSSIARTAPLCFLTRAGIELGVASTKAFTTQLVALFLLTLTLARQRGRLDDAQVALHLNGLRALPARIGHALALETQIMGWAAKFARADHALFLGRGMHYPIALEGALKLKEVSYVHAEGYPAGELKHGPLALVTSAMPVVTIAPDDRLFQKLKSNIAEVRARGGRLYVLAGQHLGIDADRDTHVIRVRESGDALSPIVNVIALQLLAYHVGCARGADVDKPRNLAKSVTVE